MSVGNDVLVTKTYAPNNGKLLSEAYGNGITFDYTYDALDRVSEICYTVNNIPQKYIYEYTSDGNVRYVESTESLRRYVYDYDTSGRCVGVYEISGKKDSQGHITYESLSEVNLMYDDKGRVNYLQISFCYTTPGDHVYSDAVTYGYVYGRDSDSESEVLTGLDISCCISHNDLTLAYHYDDFRRLDGKTITYSGGFSLETGYEFKTTNSQTTNLIRSYSSFNFAFSSTTIS